MKANRREFLWGCAGVVAAGIARGDEGEFTLGFPPAALDLRGPVGFAVVASAPCVCEPVIRDADNRSLFGAVKWDLEAKKPLSKFTSDITADGGLTPVGIQLRVYPQGRGRPHFAGLIQSGQYATESSPAGPHLTSFVPTLESDKDRLERTAEKLLFVQDPAPRPTPGYFTVNLRTESNLRLRIWPGENERGPAIYDHVFPHLCGCETPIPWSLRNSHGSVVEAGEYLATMEATPLHTGRSDTLFFASLQVV
jgi:hypothetical protein